MLILADDVRLVTEDLKAEWIYGGIAYSCITGFTSNLTVEEQQYVYEKSIRG